MIRNVRQYYSTKALLAELSSKSIASTEDEFRIKAQKDALTSQLEEFQEDIREYLRGCELRVMTDELNAKSNIEFCPQCGRWWGDCICAPNPDPANPPQAEEKEKE